MSIPLASFGADGGAQYRISRPSGARSSATHPTPATDPGRRRATWSHGTPAGALSMSTGSKNNGRRSGSSSPVHCRISARWPASASATPSRCSCARAHGCAAKQNAPAARQAKELLRFVMPWTIAASRRFGLDRRQASSPVSGPTGILPAALSDKRSHAEGNIRDASRGPSSPARYCCLVRRPRPNSFATRSSGPRGDVQ